MLPPPLAPTDRTCRPVFNKAPVLGRFLSSSIKSSRGVIQGRERVRGIESTRKRERRREMKVKRRKVKLISLTNGGSNEKRTGTHCRGISLSSCQTPQTV